MEKKNLEYEGRKTETLQEIKDKYDAGRSAAPHAAEISYIESMIRAKKHQSKSRLLEEIKKNTGRPGNGIHAPPKESKPQLFESYAHNSSSLDAPRNGYNKRVSSGFLGPDRAQVLQAAAAAMGTRE